MHSSNPYDRKEMFSPLVWNLEVDTLQGDVPLNYDM